MKRALRPAVLAVTTVALVATGGVIAYAGWSSGTDSDSFTVYAATIPRVPAPRAWVRAAAAVPATVAGTVAEPAPTATPTPAAAVRPRIGWKAVKLAPDVPVHRYVVTRHLGPVTEVVCDQPATVLRCVDRTAPAGYRMTYTVAAAYGGHWVGRDSDRSTAIVMPGVALPVTVNGVTVLPGVNGEPVVPGADPSAAPTTTAPSAPPANPPTSAPTAPIAEESDDPGTGTGITVPPRPGDVVVPSGVTSEDPDTPSNPPEAPSTTHPDNGPPPAIPGNGPPPAIPGGPPPLPF